MYQPYEDSNVFKRLRQNILEKKYFSYFFFCISREFKISKTRPRGEHNKTRIGSPYLRENVIILNPENIAMPLKKRKKKSQNGKYPVVKKSKILLVKFRILCPPAEGLDWRISIFP